MEGKNCKQHKEGGGHRGREYSGQTSRQAIMICQRLEERKIVREIGRCCNSQSRSGDYCAQISITGRKEKKGGAHVREAVMQR